MAIQIQISGLTQQQQQDIGDAFDQTLRGRADSGLTKAQWVEFQLIVFMRSVVKGWKRSQHEAQIKVEQAQVDSDFV